MWFSGMPYGKQATLNFMEAVSELTGIGINKEKLDSEIHECDKALSLVRALDDHCRCSNSVLVSGNRDAVMGMGNIIMEMGLQKSAGIINHDITGDSFEFTDSH